MSKLMRKISLLLVFIAIFISFSIYLVVYKNNPINNYFSNFTATFFSGKGIRLIISSFSKPAGKNRSNGPGFCPANSHLRRPTFPS